MTKLAFVVAALVAGISAWAADIPVPNPSFESKTTAPWVVEVTYGGNGSSAPRIVTQFASPGHDGYYSYNATCRVSALRPPVDGCTQSDAFVTLDMQQTILLDGPRTGEFSFGMWVRPFFSNGSSSEAVCRAGIDPTGGTDKNAPTVVWGPSNHRMGLWSRASVATPSATTDRLTLFVEMRVSAQLIQCNTGTTNDVIVSVSIDDARLRDQFNASPSVSIVSPPPNDPTLRPLAVQFSLNDPDSAILYCNVYRDGVLFQTMNNCPNGLNQSSLMSPSYGIHTLQVEAVDMWDNETLSPLIQFEVIPERPINNYDDKLDSYAYSGIILPVHLGGCYVVGGVTTAANGQHDTVVHRYDRNLNLIWRQPISGPIGINQTAVRAKLTPDGGLVTIGTGNVRVPWSSDLIATRFAPDGTKLWQYIYDGTPPGYPIYLNDTGKDIAVDAEGNAYLLGSTRPYGNPLDDYLVITKLSPNGTVVWSRYFGVENGLQEISAAIAVGASGLLYVASQSKLSTEWRAGTIYLYALAPSGDLLSTGKFTGPSFADQPAALAVEGDGSVYVTANIGYSATDVFMTTIKFDSFGHVDWWLPVSGGTLPNSYRKLIQIGASGCLYELGTLDDGGANTERYIIHKITPTGELVWSRSSSLTSVSATAMVLDAHENIYLVGSWFNQGVGTFGLFAKYDKDGNELYSDLCGGASGTYCLWNDVALSDTDGVYVVGGGSGIIVATTYLANGSMVYGHTELGAFAGEFGGVPFGVYIQGRQYQAATNISPLGNYWLVVPTPDPVELIVKPSHWLSVKQPFEPTTTATRLDWTFPVNGDVAQNNRIDLADLNAIFLDYGGTSSSADADGDGVVDLKDLNLIFVSFGLSGQE